MIRAHHISLLQQFSIPLIIGVIAGLIFANIDPHAYEELVDYRLFGADTTIFGKAVTVHFIINEIFMVFFFGIAAKEITESVLPGGALNPIPKAINPLMGTIGGILGPAGLFLLLAWVFYGGSSDLSIVANGWGIPTATDIALAWLVARIVFGVSHPAVNFLLLLAVADDAIGLGIIAVFYPDPLYPVAPLWLLLVVAGMGVAYAMRRFGVSYWPIYILIAGGLSWVGLVKSSVEPALALVVIVPFLPGPRQSPGLFEEDIHEFEHTHPHGSEAVPEGAASVRAATSEKELHHAHAPLDAFEHQLKLPVDFGLFFFAFANAGVAFGSITSVTFIVLISLIVGKLVGITLFSAVAERLGFPLPEGMGFKHLLVTSMIAGLGLTVALFVAGKAYTDPVFHDPAKMGAVLSASAAIIAFAVGRFLKVKDRPD
ncbi:MAG: Na+/H+ antiporter NhaA [SAR202 cluster bacterium]|nr:Na+/H+ antiporter NhaA [SAR202 cluster bacterium]